MLKWANCILENNINTYPIVVKIPLPKYHNIPITLKYVNRNYNKY